MTTFDDETVSLLEEKETENYKKRKKIIFFSLFACILVVLLALTLIGLHYNNSDNSSKSSEFYKKLVLNTPSSKSIRDNYETLASVPHVAGTPQQYQTAQDVRKYLKKLGYKAEIVEYNGTLTVPISSKLTIVDINNDNNILWSASLKEEVLAEDPYSNTSLNNKPFLAYTPSGNVIGDLVYINYGRLSDFELLVENGYNLTNKIGIVRFGKLFRGNKVYFAQKFNLSGLIIYSDPEDDGYVRGPVFPDGPWRPGSSFQRGTTMYDWQCVGDPNEERLSRICPGVTYDTLTSKIPAIPIGYNDARILLSNLTGESVNNITGDNSWQGGLNFEYFIGGNNGLYVNLDIINEIQIKPIYNVIAKLKTNNKNKKYNLDEKIIIGHHRDAWVMGASDDISGGVVLLEMAKIFSKFKKKNYNFKRDIIFTSWDGEEYGLIGSCYFTEDEQMYSEYFNNTVTYINIDVGIDGDTFNVNSNPLFNQLLIDIMKDNQNMAPYNYSNMTLYQLFEYQNSNIGVLGTGSDYTPFQHRFGIPSLYANFVGKAGLYHSVYDDITYMNIVDKNQEYAVTLAKYLSLVTYSIIDNDVLPFNLTTLSTWMNEKYDQILSGKVYNSTQCNIGNIASSNILDTMKNTLFNIQFSFDSFTEDINDLLSDYNNPNNELKVDSKGYYKDIKNINNGLITVSKLLLNNNGISGGQIYYKNILFGSDPIGEYSILYYPEIVYYMRYDCTSEGLDYIIDLTSDILRNVTCYLDDLGWADISLHNAEYSTPNLDKILSEGIELNNYYTHLTCTPTRAAIMTGKYSWKTGLQSPYTIDPGMIQYIPWEMPTVAELLQETGYQTHGLGKWHLGYAAWNMTPIERGFDSYYGFFQGAQNYWLHTFWSGYQLMTGYDFWNNYEVDTSVAGNYSTDIYVEHIDNILYNYTYGSNKKPIYIYGSFQTVHSPILHENPPIKYDECLTINNEGRQIYCNKMKYLDSKILDIINLFKTYNLWDNTILMLSTDNGGMPMWSDNPPVPAYVSYGCNWPLRGGKATGYQGGLKGIGALYGPLVDNKGLNGTKSNILAHAMDWLPTIIEGFANGTLPNNKQFDGQNMWNVMGKTNDISLWNRTILYSEIQAEMNASVIISGDWKYIDQGIGNAIYDNWYLCNQTMVGNYSLNIRYSLFNITEDPYEQNNVFDLHPEVVYELRQLVQYQIDNYYYPEQSRKMHYESLPELHNGVYAPWIGPGT